LFARPCGLDGSVERKQIRLFGNVPDDLEDVGDLLAIRFETVNEFSSFADRAGNLVNFRAGIRDDFLTAAGDFARFPGQATGLASPVGDMVDADREFLDGCCHVGRRCGLLLRGSGDVTGGRVHFVGGRGDRTRALGNRLETRL